MTTEMREREGKHRSKRNPFMRWKSEYTHDSRIIANCIVHPLFSYLLQLYTSWFSEFGIIHLGTVTLIIIFVVSHQRVPQQVASSAVKVR